MSLYSDQIFAIVGPESTGKTTLCHQLSNHFNGLVVPEYAREYLNSREGRYTRHDLIHIAKQQLLSEQRMAALEQRPIFCDTDILVVMIWQKFKFGKADKKLERLFASQLSRKYLLTYPDLPWQPDPLRENEHQLEELFDLYDQQLTSLNLEYRVIIGTGAERFKNALNAVDQLKLG